jgi:4'-phosphopantetheinyl transferase
VSAFLPRPGRATVVVIDPARADGRHLAPAERETAARFHFEKDARHWSACRSALRRILGEALELAPLAVPLVFGPHGKPLLAAPHHGLHFNLSHCADLALLALGHDGPLGIDLEAADRAPSLLGCEEAFCHPEEIVRLPLPAADRAAALLDLWTAKEAALKALGTGMSLAPQSVALDPAGQRITGHPGLEALRLRRLAHPALARHVACIALPAATAEIEIVPAP